MQKFGLIGKTLKHSYSKTIHHLLGDYEYDLIELEEDKVKSFVLSKEYDGYNVTIPYKQTVMQYLDEIDQTALDIGAVNTVVNKNGKLIGYNTDIFGMKYALDRANINLKDKVVLILGSGGTSKTATALAKREGAKEILILSRSGEVNYQNYFERRDVQVVINTTPVGMFPNNYECKIDLDNFFNLEGVFDAIYNPNLTYLTYKAKEKFVKYSNGLPMLVAQAKGAMQLFLDKDVNNSVIEKILQNLKKDTLNVVLIGMSGSGKTSVGKELAKTLGREFVDTDKLIEERENRDIPTIFKDSGEAYFRQVEKAVLKEQGKLTGKVIATGGGVIKDRENYFSLKQNGVIVYIKRDLEKLDRKNRPLATDLNAVKKLFEERKGLYLDFADFLVDNNDELQNTVKEILEKYESFGD